MREKIKNATILKKTVRPDKAQMLKQVQHDMFVQGDMMVQDDVSVQHDMKVSCHCERTRSNPANYFARSADKVISPLTFHFSQRCAFTLAEVLITLGIIGIVAALTIPTLVQNYKRHVVETKLRKFYTTINQAVTLSEVDNGDKCDWYFTDLKGGAKLDEDGKPIEGSSNVQNWFNKYLAPYMNIEREEFTHNGALIIYLPDGTSFGPENPNASQDWVFRVNPSKCPFGTKAWGTCAFQFQYYPCDSTWWGWKHNYNKGFEPYKFNWDGNYESLKADCADTSKTPIYCTALIQQNGWKIPKDYPLKF